MATENQATGPRSAVCIKVKSDATGTNRQLDSARVKECLKELRSRRWSSEVSVIFRAGRHQLTWAPKGRRLCRLVFYFFFSGKQRRLLAVGQAVFNGFENSRFIVLEIDSKKGSLLFCFVWRLRNLLSRVALVRVIALVAPHRRFTVTNRQQAPVARYKLLVLLHPNSCFP